MIGNAASFAISVILALALWLVLILLWLAAVCIERDRVAMLADWRNDDWM